MHLLVVGGSAFLGRHTVEGALRRGWTVTTFNRGRSGPDVDRVEALHGDRSVPADLEQLRGRRFDAVVDTCGFVPRVVGLTTDVLAGLGRALRLRLEPVGHDHVAARADAGRGTGTGVPVGCGAGRR